MRLWFIWGMLSAVVVSSIASVPNGSVAIQSEVSEIRTQRVHELSTDQDIRRLSQAQGRYRENLPVAKKKDSIKVRQSAPIRKKPSKTPVKAPVKSKKATTPKKKTTQTKNSRTRGLVISPV